MGNATTRYGPRRTRPPQTRRSLWVWACPNLACLTAASVLVGRTWSGIGVAGEPAAARWWVLTRAWLPLTLAPSRDIAAAGITGYALRDGTARDGHAHRARQGW